MNDPAASPPDPNDGVPTLLPPEIGQLLEPLAEAVHEAWAAQRRADGWRYGQQRSDQRKEHPGLLPYADLPESEKQYDRQTVRGMLRALAALGYQVSRPSRVAWLPRAQGRIREPGLIARWNRELEAAFPATEFVRITVSDVFRGYAADDHSRIILGVQLHRPHGPGASNIVKLGDAKVRRDLEGWRECMQGVPSRLLVGVEGRSLPEDRYAVIYQNAYQLFGTDPDTESPKPLEMAADWAITDRKPDILSVEQVLGQIYEELNRCLYQGANDDHPDRVCRFYSDELAKGGPRSAVERWRNQEPFWSLRRDAIWLTGGRAEPDTDTLPGYLDPLDYVHWVLATGRVPPTLVGRSHGDLHGRNILVGVQRGIVQQPAIFDYGDMSGANVLVWDFVKLETELKTRVLPKLADDADARAALARVSPPPRPPLPADAALPPQHDQEIADRAGRLEFAYEFETYLASLTRAIVGWDVASHARPADQRRPTGHPALDKALCLFYRLRQEAALWLGYQAGRPGRWRDEFYFALAVYGVLKAKWNPDVPQLEWALISAGVAAAQLSQAGEINRLRRQPPPDPLPESLPSHLVPLAWAHTLWTGGQTDRGCRILEDALARFPCAVPLRTEYALCLAVCRNLDRAVEEVGRLHHLCLVFRDHEMLCRLGRVYKDLADATWDEDHPPPDFQVFIANRDPALQLYQEAYQFYAQAFAISRDYYPGINAATLARLTGQTEAAERLAGQVLDLCRQQSILDPKVRFWVCATQGEANLLLGKGGEALRFYQASLATPTASQPGKVNGLYKQLCRLAWALGPENVRPIIAELDRLGLLGPLPPGPFSRCALPPKASRKPRRKIP